LKLFVKKVDIPGDFCNLANCILFVILLASKGIDRVEKESCWSSSILLRPNTSWWMGEGDHASFALHSSSVYLLSPGGLRLVSLPAIPALIICMPMIIRIIPMIKPAKTAPKNGDAIIKIANITAKTPTPMEKPRDHPLCVLSPNPCIILAMP
jgi:hypothetical protein